MSDLTPEMQRFFETGDIADLKLDGAETGAAPAPEAPTNDALDLQALGNVVAPAPASVAAPAPAPVAAPVQDPSAVVQTPEVVEVLRRSLAEAQQELANLRAAQTLQKQPDPEPQGPDPEVDPLGAFMHKLETIQKQINAINEAQAQTSQQSEQMAQFNAFRSQVRSLADDFMKTHADFPAAHEHLRAIRTADLQALGLTAQDINRVIAQEELALSQNAIKNARNPAEVVYETAKRHGYAPKAAPAPAPATPSAEAIQRAQAASRQLPNAAPAAQEGEITEAALRDMSEADLNKLILNSANWNKLTGADQYPL